MRNLLLRLFRGRYGAYGTDNLTRFLLVLAIITLLVSISIESLNFFYYVAIIIIVFCYFSLFSKNVTKRYKENEAFISFTKKILSVFKKGKK